MKQQILFEERQKFNQWWLWVLLVCINGVFIYGALSQLIGGKPFGDRPIGDNEFLLVTLSLLLLTILFFSFRLDTIIKEDGVYVRFFPLHLRFRHYAWNSLKKSFVKKYAPLTDYGGWGLRLGLFGKGTAYNVSGNKGLQLVFTNNKRLLIGTKKPTELTDVLREINQHKP